MIFSPKPVRIPKQVAPVSRWSLLYYALPCALVWGIYLLAFWPGIMSYDSLDQWGQIVSGRFQDAHPAFHTMSMWLITRLGSSPALVAISQIIMLSVVAGWGFKIMRELGAPRGLVLLACILFALLPWSGSWVIVIWKDIPYGIVLLALTLVMILIVRDNGRWLSGRWAWLVMGGLLSLAALFRHNGCATAIGTPIVLAFCYRRYWRTCLAALGLALGLWLFVHVPLYRCLHVETMSSESGQRLVYYPVVAQVAAYVAGGTMLLPAEREYLNRIQPLDGWYYDGNDYNINRQNNLNWAVILNDPSAFRRVFRALLLRRPSVSIAHCIRHSATIWRPLQARAGDILYIGIFPDAAGRPAYIHPVDNQFGLRPASKLPQLSVWLTKLILRSQKGRWNIWGPASYLYFFLIGVAWAAWRSGNARVWLLAVPVSLHTLLLVLFMSSPESRYQYPVFLIAAVLWVGLFFGHFPALKNNDVPAKEIG